MVEGEAVVMKAASRARLSGEREKRATCGKPCVANRRGICEPIIGPEPMTKRGPGAIGGREPWEGYSNKASESQSIERWTKLSEIEGD